MKKFGTKFRIFSSLPTTAASPKSPPSPKNSSPKASCRKTSLDPNPSLAVLRWDRRASTAYPILKKSPSPIGRGGRGEGNFYKTSLRLDSRRFAFLSPAPKRVMSIQSRSRVQGAANFLISSTARTLSSALISPGSFPRYAARATRRMIFALRVRGRSFTK